MDISTFKGLLGAGGARPNQFRVTLNTPAGGGALDQKSLLVTGAALPASNVNPTIVQYRGREVKLAGERIFDPWTVTIVNDSEFSLHAPLMAWMNSINNVNDNTGVITPNEYYAQLEVEHLDRNDNTIAKYVLRDAFPINISEIALNYGQNDVIEEFSVTFQYQDYVYTSNSGSVGTA